MADPYLGPDGWETTPNQLLRQRVDDDEIGFWSGWQFRAYSEINKDAVTVQAFMFSSPIDFILLAQRIELDSGGVRLSAWINGTPGGSWTSVPVIGKNRMANRQKPYYQSQVTLSTGGTFDKTGATEVDLIRIKSATATAQSTNVGAGMDDARGLPAGTYIILLEQIEGSNDAVLGKFELIWEERP